MCPIATQSHDQPEILYGPDEVYGYEGNQLFLAVVTNFHNEIGETYEWSLDGNTVLRGVTNPGTYFCKVLYGDMVLLSNCVVVKAKRAPEMSSGVSSFKADRCER